MASIPSQIIYKMMKRLKFNLKLEKEMNSKTFGHQSSKRLSKRNIKQFHIKEVFFEQQSTQYWNLKENSQQTIIFYLHGGAFVHGLSNMHYQLFKQIIDKTDCALCVPDYPLVPHADVEDIYTCIENAYGILKEKALHNQVILMGDSAGGCLALGLAERLYQRFDQIQHPLILVSPWLDLTMANGKLEDLKEKDVILNPKTLKDIAHMYANTHDLSHPNISPVYGAFKGVSHVSLWVGTHEIFYADAMLLKEKLGSRQDILNLYIYEDMLHTWIFFGIEESKKAIHEIHQTILSFKR